MSAIVEMDEGTPRGARQQRKVPVPFTRNLNNHTTKAVMADVRMEEECIPGMVKESTVWDVYNNEARKVDNELVKDWTASLNFLLVFAAIFAAVLTGFIIESKKMLEQDHTEVLVDIAIQYFNSIGDQSRNNLTRPNFEPTSAAISINCLLFASLGASLVAALASVVALQWVAEYDGAITRGGSSPLDRAKRRQFRFAGVTRWKMGEFIAALPLLLHSSVILFWAGAIQWMWTLHHIVGYVVASGTAIAVLFYASTTIFGAIHLSSPFRTPLSRGLYWLPLWMLSLVGRFLLWLPIEGPFRFSSKLYQTVSSYIRSLIASNASLDDKIATYSFSLSFQDSSPVRLSLFEAIRKWIETHLLTSGTSRSREDETAKQDLGLEQEALAWLAQQLPVSDDAHERLLLCVSGILALSAQNPSPRFNDAPWLAILDLLSAHFLHQIFDPTSSEKDYSGVGVLLQCIDSPFIRRKVVPDASYIGHPGRVLETGGILCFGGTRSASMTFLIAQDVPVPSLGSKHELEAAWKLIRWRNSAEAHIKTEDWIIYEKRDDSIWSEVFSNIRRYSPEFLESCLRHFRTSINILEYDTSGPSNTAVMFDSIVENALDRGLTPGHALALARAFAGHLTRSAGYRLSETVDETNVISQPLLYALAVGLSSESTQATHLAITLLVVRAARSSLRAERPQWARWITLMLWISTPKEPGYLVALQEDSANDNEDTQKLWDEIEMSSPGIVVEGPHVGEIARLLWQVDNGVVASLSRDAFGDPQSLRYLELLLQWIPHCYTHHTGSQHILLHLYQGAENDFGEIYAGFNAEPPHLDSIDWTIERFNPILAMLTLSDTQDLVCLHFGGVDLECARRILEILKAVKMQPVAFLCLLTDIATTNHWRFRPAEQVLILEALKQAMVFMDEESTALFLLPLASGVQTLEGQVWSLSDDFPDDSPQDRGTIVEAQRICGLLQAKYAARFISSTAQLRLLSCARSAAVAQPATGWLGIHVPL